MQRETHKIEVTKPELNLDELEKVSGGSMSELLNAFSMGIAKGWAEAGGHVTIKLLP
jgi:hypothetical protein